MNEDWLGRKEPKDEHLVVGLLAYIATLVTVFCIIYLLIGG